MNELSARTVVEYEPHTVMVDDGEGNLVESTETVAIVYLYITVEHKTAEDIQVEYSFDKDCHSIVPSAKSPSKRICPITSFGTVSARQRRAVSTWLGFLWPDRFR